MTNRWTMKMFAAVTCVVIGGWFVPNVVHAVVPVRVNSDYTASPPFVSNIATPNILIVMDNSGSMANRACESASCGTLSDGTTSTVTTFVATTRYNGYADPLRCYVWDSTDNRFEIGGGKSRAQYRLRRNRMGRQFHQLGHIPTLRCRQEGHDRRQLLAPDCFAGSQCRWDL